MVLVVTVAPPGEFLDTFTLSLTVLPDTVTVPAPLLTPRSPSILVLVMLTAPEEPFTVTFLITVPPLIETAEAPTPWMFPPMEAPVSVRLDPLDRVKSPVM